MLNNGLTRDELVDLATMIYGAGWRETLADALNITRKQLVLTLAAGDPVPEDIVTPFLSVVETHLADQKIQQRKIEERLALLRGGSAVQEQPMVKRKSAS